MKKLLCTGVLAVLLMASHGVWADLEIVREVTIAPKNGRVLANIGSVNQSYNIRMIKAVVEIEVGKVPAEDKEPVVLNVHALFTMKNESPEKMDLTVGFPVSNSRFSAFDFKSFLVETGGFPRSVFNRLTGYPNYMKHFYVSGPEKESYTELPDYPELNAESGAPDTYGFKRRNVFVVEKIGEQGFHNLMVWREMFEPDQTQIVDIRYTIEIPPQKNKWEQKKAKGNYKGIWPEEANNLPISFLESIPHKEVFYFFDYYLVSGASWKGTIGEEVITLRLDDSWGGHKLYSNHRDKLTRTGELGTGENNVGLTYTYILRDAEPTDNLYFALKRP